MLEICSVFEPEGRRSADESDAVKSTTCTGNCGVKSYGPLG